MCCAAVTAGFGQTTDTISVLQYNLLNYAASDNPSSYKNPRLQTIINYCDPDIFGANEIAYGSQNAQNILNNVLGAAWEKGSYINSNNSIQTNMLFWKKDKFGLVSQESITSVVRDIIAYKLYYKDPNLSISRDTTYLTVIVAHLKAGSSEEDSAERFEETNIVAGYLESVAAAPGNCLFMGDLNVYSSYEACYSRLVNSSSPLSRFYDPINRPGYWNGNNAFADIHSQSTRKVYLPDGGVTGGLDDRFDQILISGPVHDNMKRIKYLPASYHVVAQDGLHFNKGLLDNPVNTSVPPSVLQALYEMSDHLPIAAKFVVQHSNGVSNIAGAAGRQYQFTAVNPAEGHHLTIHFNGQVSWKGPLTVNLCGLEGKAVFKSIWQVNSSLSFSTALPASGKGIYLLHLTNASGETIYRQLLLVP
jgi:hypothetical protein